MISVKKNISVAVVNVDTCSVSSHVVLCIVSYNKYENTLYRWIRHQPMKAAKQEKIVEGAADDDLEVWEYILSFSHKIGISYILHFLHYIRNILPIV